MKANKIRDWREKSIPQASEKKELYEGKGHFGNEEVQGTTLQIVPAAENITVALQLLFENMMSCMKTITERNN